MITTEGMVMARMAAMGAVVEVGAVVETLLYFADGSPVNLDLSGLDGEDGEDGEDGDRPYCRGRYRWQA